MVRRQGVCCIFLVALFLFAIAAQAQQPGSIRGNASDKDFDVPIGGVRVSIAETRESVETGDDGNYVFPQVAPGAYTLIFSKDSYTRVVTPNVVVTPGALAEVNAVMAGEFTEMEEFIVQDVQLAGGSEIALLQLRVDSPALLDSIGSDIMKQAGAGDAASALKLVAGATVQDGKYATIRGLPDRYVNSQINGVRLPTADPDKRAVQLDQFPASAIESIQVSKTFTPDQQGDASGGAVNIKLKAIPDKWEFKLSAQGSYEANTWRNSNFLSYKGGGFNYFGRRSQERIDNGDISPTVGVSRIDSPKDYKWSLSVGGKQDFSDYGFKLGGYANFFYERSSSYYDDGINDRYWVENPGDPLTPRYTQGSPAMGDFKTSLFDVTQGVQTVKWGGLGGLGIETENNSLMLEYLYTRVADDVATLAEDTRGKAYYFPGFNPDDPNDPGNIARDAAPYLRTETLAYTERITQMLQFSGKHTLPLPEIGKEGYLKFQRPELDWSVARSFSLLLQPDKRQFAEKWWGPAFNPGFPPYVPPGIDPPVHQQYKPGSLFTLGNLQRVWKSIDERSEQYAWNLKLPFEQWTGSKGYVKFGIFDDSVHREYKQNSFSNFNDNTANFYGPWDDFWSGHFPDEGHPLTASDIDVNYVGNQHVWAWYYMADLPLTSWFNIIGGARHESTELSIINFPEKDVTWFPPGSIGSVALKPGDADVAFHQTDILPSYGFKLTPTKNTTIRGVYSATVARQTFKELTPIQQQEYLGADVFIGNPFLQMSALKNYDLRFDYNPYEGGLVSLSWFYKTIENPIEYVQRVTPDFSYTTPLNFPKGKLGGYEVEVRQKMGNLWAPLDGLTLGANGTLIHSKVTLSPEESAQFDRPNIQAPIKTRPMTNAPNHLYNLYLTYEMDKLGLKGTEASLFYTVRGDTLVAGAGQNNGHFIPDVYEKEYGTLNFSLSQKIGDAWKIQFAAKNLLNPDIQSVYRSKYIDKEMVKTSYKKGIELSFGVSAEF